MPSSSDPQFLPPVYVALKLEFQAFVARNFGAQKVAAHFCRVEQGAISDYGNRNTDDFAPIDVVVDLAKASGDASYLGACAAVLGYEIVRLPTPTRQRGTGAGVRAIKESAEAISAVSDVTALGAELDEGLRLRALREAREAIDALLEEIAWLEAVGTGKGRE